jgi:hypothetical protein
MTDPIAPAVESIKARGAIAASQNAGQAASPALIHQSAASEHGSRTEEILRTEIRHAADVMLNLVKWGITVEIAVSSLIFYARREIRSDAFLSALPKNAPLPWRVYVIGTLFLTMLALLFTILLWLVQRRRMHYRRMLFKLPNKLVDEAAPTKYGSWIYSLMFWSFPAFDLAVRAYYVLFLIR